LRCFRYTKTLQEKPVFKTNFSRFAGSCFSGIWKGKKYKPYILKYKALVLK